MKKFILTIIAIIFTFSSPAESKDFELILYKGFLQKLMDNIFPVNISESQVSQNPNLFTLGYKITARNPALSIKPQYIQVDILIDINTTFGNDTLPAECKLVPVYNPSVNNIEFKVIEGKVELAFALEGQKIDLGYVDLAPFISSIKIPLEINNIRIKDKTISPKIQDVTFQLLDDRVVVDTSVGISQ